MVSKWPHVNMRHIHLGFNKNVLSQFKWFWFYLFCAGKSDVSGYKRNARYNLSVPNLLPSKHQWKTVRETYGITSYGSGWRKDVVNQLLEVAVTAKSGVAYWRCTGVSPASQNRHLVTSGQNDPWCSRLTDLLQWYQHKSNWLGMYGGAWCHHWVRHHEMWLVWIWAINSDSNHMEPLLWLDYRNDNSWTSLQLFGWNWSESLPASIPRAYFLLQWLSVKIPFSRFGFTVWISIKFLFTAHTCTAGMYLSADTTMSGPRSTSRAVVLVMQSYTATAIRISLQKRKEEKKQFRSH